MTNEAGLPGGRVFVVQRPAFYDREKRGWVNKYDISPAREFGELVYLLRPGNLYRDQLATTLVALRSALADFSLDDYLLAIGDPVAIAAAVIAASQRTGGRVHLLKYDRMSGSYASYLVDLAPNDGSKLLGPCDMVPITAS